MRYTQNDDYTQVECPNCGHLNDWTDLACDCCLSEGREESCDGCGKVLKISEIEYNPTIWVEVA